MKAEEKPTTAFILSLIAGILILLGGIVSLVFTAFMTRIFGGWPEMMRGMMRDEWSGMMGWWAGLGAVLSIIGLASGVIVIYAAAMLNSKPEQHTAWGTLILVFSILSVVGAWAGFGVGLILGIVGGALALSWKPTAIPPTPTARFCVHCGQSMPQDAGFCPHCGKEQAT
ncbi:MAG: DUF4064 domain-containing protein [Nitrososphaeria archaeon]|nr:DUF4064 domain-containing protein [Nitrososphaeria archaeon]NIQ34122.1 DUF4064 domain-containing protein [Nitrososphaeria archaeon]